MNNLLKTSILNGGLILFLGAGASKNCLTTTNTKVLDGDMLAKELANRANISFDNDSLDEVYTAARRRLGSRLDQILEELFRNTQPSDEYKVLAKYAWRRIYTLNIDDGLDRALNNSSQNIYLRLPSDSIDERDPFFRRLDYIKLNGSIDRLDNGIIFSSSEYAKATSRVLPWYEQCASDFIRTPFLFIGTKLREPLFKFHIERYKTINNKSLGTSFVITPEATESQKESLLEYNIIHITGTLSTFTDWIQREYPNYLTPEQLAIASFPPYANFLTAKDKDAHLELLNDVILVSVNMVTENDMDVSEGAVRQFYKGFQPTWKDIIDEIPAKLTILDHCISIIEIENQKIIPLIGPAGSGKTTLLMMICYQLCRSPEFTVYFLTQPLSKLDKTLEELERASPNVKQIYVAIDNVDFVADQLTVILKSGRLCKTTIICAERENSWSKRTKHKLANYFKAPIMVREFSEIDAKNILDKIKLYGSWTNLGQMTPQQRIYTLINGAKKQLLIALLEATYGRGFEEIIESDYAALTTEEEKIFLLVVGVITDKHCDAPIGLVDRALSAIGILSGSLVLAENLAGIVIKRGDKLTVRHPVYVRYLLERVVDPKLTATSISGLLQAFSQYDAPIIKHLRKTEATIYKGLINHRFLWDVLKGRETLIIPLYKNLEKYFEFDGLFWLQYALSLRDFHCNLESLEKLRTAYSAYQMDHTQHALGQQLIIVASETSDKRIAMNYFEEARALLEPLDAIIDSDDTYPIVTLAEGHTTLIKLLDGIEAAQDIAKTYLPNINKKCESLPNNEYLTECYEKLFRFATTGTWVEKNHKIDNDLAWKYKDQ